MNEGNEFIKGEKEPMTSALKKEDVYIKELDPELYYESGFPREMKRTKHDLPISERLKEARMRKGLSLQNVADQLKNIPKIGIKPTRSNIQGYEAPEDKVNHRYPSLFVFYSLCKIYDVNVDYVLGFSDEMERPSNDLIEHLSKANDVMVNGEKMQKGEIDQIITYAMGLVNLRKSLS